MTSRAPLMLLFHRLTENEIKDAITYLAELPAGDRRKLPVAKLMMALKSHLDHKQYDKLPFDHRARVDPDYPPNAYLEEL